MIVHPDDADARAEILLLSPSILVPCLTYEGIKVWDTLAIGEFLNTGTVSGVAAFSADPKAWYLKPGDVMECEIEQIGVLRNPVISWEEAYGEKPPAGVVGQGAMR